MGSRAFIMGNVCRTERYRHLCNRIKQASDPDGPYREAPIHETGLHHFFPAIFEKEKAQAARLGCENLESVLITAR
jgi:hypothetical protein